MNLRRILIAAIALLLAIGSVAQASTYYYFRGGAQATQASGSKPVSPAPQGAFAILIDAPEIGIRGTGYSATTYAYSNVGAVVFSVRSGVLPAGISINATTGTISGTPSAIGTSSLVIQGVDSSTGSIATVSLTIEVDDPFSISGTPGAQVLRNSPYSADFTLAGGGQPYGFSVGALPPGLAFNAGGTTANIGGVPTQAGSYNIIVTGSDVHGLVAQYPYTLQVYDALAVSGAPPAAATVGTPYSGQVAVTGGAAPYTYTLAAGTLPTGVTLKASTGVISGTPTTAGVKSNIKIKVADATGQSATSAAFSISVAATGTQPLTISVTPATTGRENQSYTTQYTAGGGSGSYSFSMVGGALPAGVALNANSGLISGAPLGGTAGTYPNITAQVVDTATHQAAAAPYTLTIAPAQIALSVTGSPSTSVQVGSPYAAQFAGNGGTGAGYVFALGAGTLPAGLSLSPTGMLSGTPSAVGTYSGLRIRVTDNASNTALSNQFTINVVSPPPLTISGTPVATVNVGDSYSATWTAFDGSGAGYHFVSVGSALPPGLSLSDINGAQGLLSGIATTAGTYSGLRIKVSDSLGNTATTPAFSITAATPPPPGLPETPLALFGSPVDAVYGQPYSVTFAAGGGSPSYVYSINGTLPAGLTLDPVSGALAGTPSQIGNFPGLQVTVTDSLGATVSSAVFAINVADPNPLSISWIPQTSWQVGDFVAVSPNTVGGDNSNYSFSSVGALPPGLSLFSNGTLFGNLTQAGSFGPFQIQVTDGVRTATTQAVTFSVAAPGLFVSGFPAANADENQAYSAQFSAQGGSSAGYVFSINGSLPNGLTLDPSSGLISGTPAIGSAATYANLSVHVADDAGAAADSATFSIVVHPLPPLVVIGSPPTASTLGGSYSTVFSATGGTSSGYVFSLGSGSLPPGLSLTTAGTLAGSPTAVGTFGPITVKVTDSASQTAQSSPFSIDVVEDNPLSISWNPTSVYAVGDAVLISPAASGGVSANYVFGYTGTLPDGTSLNIATGAITGTATTGGTFGPITITVTDGLRTAATAAKTFTVNGVISVSGTPSANAAVGQSYSAQFSATGGTGTGLVYASTGTALPAGLTLNPSNGLLSGTPTAAGTVSGIVIRVTDDGGHATSTAPFQIAVADVLALASTTPAGSAGNAYAGSFTASGGRSPFSYALTVGTLPTGLTLNPSSGAFTGTPTLAETQTFTVTVTDANANTATRQVTLTINAATASATLATGSTIRSSAAIGGTLASSLPTPAWTFASTPSSPALGLTGSGGAFAGTAPTVASSTAYSVTATATKGSVTADATPFALTVLPPLTISGTPSGTISGTPGNAIATTAAPTVSGNQGALSYALLQGGSLATLDSVCPGLSFSTAAGTVSGTPTATCTSGTLTIRVTDATDGATATSAQSFTITIASGSAVAILTTPATVHPGQPIAGTLSTSYTAATWSFAQTPTSPQLGLTNAGGTFSGTAPSVASSTIFSIVATASQGGTSVLASAVPLTVKPALSIAGGPSGTLSGTTGIALSPSTPSVSNQIGAVSYALLQAGSAYTNLATDCPGLSFSSSTGAISGTPSVPCSITDLTIRVTDAADATMATTTTPFAVAVVDPPLVISGSAPGAFYGQAYSAQFTTSGGSGAGVSFSLVQGGLPPGLTLSAAGLISGTPTDFSIASGIRLQAIDSRGNSATTAPFLIAVADPNPMSVSWSPQTSYLTGAPVSVSVTVSGGNPANYAFSASGTAIAGLTVNGATGAVTGSLGSAGSYGPMSVTATDGIRTVTTSALTFTATDPTASATRTSAATARTGQAISGTLLTNIPGATWSFASAPASPAIPLTASDTTFSGAAPAVATPTSYSVVASATGSVSADAAPFSITVAPALTMSGGATGTISGQASFAIATTPAVSFGTTNVAANPTLQILNGGSPWNIATNCGLTLNADGSISGTPTSGCSASGLVIRATDSDGATAQSGAFSISIASPPAAPSGSYIASAPVSVAYSSTAVTGSGGTAPYVWSVASGTLPTGLSLNPSNGALTGTPTAVASYTFAVKFTDARGAVSPASAQQTISVTSTPTPTGSVIANATAGTAYSSSGLVSGSGGLPPYTWSIASGYLPIGLSINPSNGAISGVPTDTGTWSFTVRLTDASGAPGIPTGAYSITVTGVQPAAAPGGGCGGSPYFPTNRTLAVLPNTAGTVIIDSCWNYPLHANTGVQGPAQVTAAAFSLSSGISFACDGPIIFPETQTYSTAAGWTTIPAVRSCNLYSAPVVTPAFLSQLQAAGYQYTIVYPETDNGNGRALVMFNNFPLSVTPSHGIARITGMAFQDQFPSKTYQYVTCDERNLCIYPTGGTFTYANDDTIGQYFATLGYPQRNSTVRGYIQSYGGIAWDGQPLTGSVVITDDWLRQTATPAPSGSFAAATVGSPYSSQISGSGTWSITSGSLPPGLALNASTGIVSGTPGGVGTYSFGITVSANGVMSTATPTSITVGPASVATSVNTNNVRQGQTVTGSLSTSLTGATWTVASSPVSTWNVTGATFSGTAPAVGSTTSMSVTGTASISGYSQAGTAATVTVHPAVSLTVPSGIAGNAGTQVSFAPTPKDLMGTPSYTLLQNGSAVAGAATNLGGICTGLSFSSANGQISGAPASSCNASGLAVRMVDGYDGSTGTSNTFSIAVVFNSTNVFNSSGSWTITPYNTLRIKMWSGAGGSAALTNGGYGSVAGGNGSASAVPALGLNAPGGIGASGYAGGGYSGTPSGGNVANVPGNPGGSGSGRVGTVGDAWPWAAGGSAYAGGAGAPGGSQAGAFARAGVAGGAPGGGASGASQQGFYGIGSGWISAYAGGGGSGSYLEVVYTAGQAGAPPPGTVLGFTVGTGGAGGVTIVQLNGAAGGNGQIQFIVQ